MKPILPVTIIGGYLGSGKTTLVNHLLRHADGLRVAVLVNDFGELPIDADLIQAQDGDVISLSGGCVCCSYGDDLSLSLQKLQNLEQAPEHILIEASGVALPGAIGNTLSLQQSYQLEGIVVLVDAATVKQQAKEKYIGDTILRQLADADLLILNKLDDVSDEAALSTREWLDSVCTGSPQIDAVHAKIDPDWIYRRMPEQFRQQHETNQFNANVHTHAESLFMSMHVLIDWSVDATELAEGLAAQNLNLIRAKGFVRDSEHGLKTIQVVGRRWSVTQLPAHVSADVQLGLVCIAKVGQLSETSIHRLCEQQKVSSL